MFSYKAIKASGHNVMDERWWWWNILMSSVCVWFVSQCVCMNMFPRGVFVAVSKRDAAVSEREQSNEGAGDISCL